MRPKALVLQAHGTNRDLDVMNALTLAGADAIGVPLNQLRIQKRLLRDFQLLVLPGGFSYADALGAGKLLAVDLNTYFMEEITAFVAAGKPVIGICNGFQALIKSGILPGNPSSLTPLPIFGEGDGGEGATLTFNQRGHFECRWVTMKSVSETCIWTKGLSEAITCPVAHGEGNFQVGSEYRISNIEQHIALTYIHPNGSSANGEYPFNPNGSFLDIAGICNHQGNVLGLMPHPENHIFSYQHPRHTRGETGQSGLTLFQNGVNYGKQM